MGHYNEIERTNSLGVPGGWSSFRDLTRAEEGIFYEALRHTYGAKYCPLLVSTQVVAGINYRFIASQMDIRTCQITELVLITVYENPQGTISLTSIEKITEIQTATSGSIPL